jgi:hypothetical protein
MEEIVKDIIKIEIILEEIKEIINNKVIDKIIIEDNIKIESLNKSLLKKSKIIK